MAEAPAPEPPVAPTPQLPAVMPAAWRRYWVLDEASVPTAPPPGEALEVATGEALVRAVNSRDGPRVRYLRIPPLAGAGGHQDGAVPDVLRLPAHLHVAAGVTIFLDCRFDIALAPTSVPASNCSQRCRSPAGCDRPSHAVLWCAAARWLLRLPVRHESPHQRRQACTCAD